MAEVGGGEVDLGGDPGGDGAGGEGLGFEGGRVGVELALEFDGGGDSGLGGGFFVEPAEPPVIREDGEGDVAFFLGV